MTSSQAPVFRNLYFFSRLLLACHLLCLLPRNAAAQDSLSNLPVLSRPLTDRKLVIAHCMTNIIRFKGHPFEDGCNPDHYPVDDPATASLGGLAQVRVMEDSLLRNATLEEAVSFEMHAALRSGIDGFQFYYTLGNESWDEIIKAYFRVADREQLDFKLTLCLSHPSGSTEEKKTAAFARRINGIMNAVGRQNPHWLRTPDGRLIVYLWYGEQLADVPERSDLPPAFYAARAYRRLADAVHDQFAPVFSINEKITPARLNQWLDYFPAVWIWTLAFTPNYIGYEVAEACKKRGRTFTGSAFPDFYTSKLLAPGTWNILDAKQAVRAGLSGVERKAVVTGLSYNFRHLLEFAIAENVGLINIITWNDYPEGHHLAPEWCHQDGFSLLLRYYKSLWKEQAPDVRDVAMVFYKKYAHDAAPFPYHVRLVYFEEGAVPPASEDSIELITILSAPGRVRLNGRAAEVQPGLQVTKWAPLTGALRVEVYRRQDLLLSFEAPERITDRPYRTDRLTYSYSSVSEAYYRSLLHISPLPPDMHDHNLKQ